jgi:hypothetical protein
MMHQTNSLSRCLFSFWSMLIGVAVLGGCSGISRSEQARYRGAAIGAFGFLAACPVEEPSDPDSDSKCINCNGTGKIGDGRIVKKCSICNGTGKSNTVGALTSPSNDGDSNHEQLVRTITIFSRPGCGKCDQWLASEAPKWKAQGFEVIEARQQGSDPVPSFLIQEDSRRLRVTSESPWETYNLWRKTRD